MGQPRIVIEIFDDAHGQSIGAEIRAILEQESRYEICLIEEPLLDRTLGFETRPELIIPLLPASKQSAGKLLGALRAKYADTILLPVLRLEDFSNLLDELSLWTDDFIVTPLRAAEVLERVRRLLSQSRQQERHKPDKKGIDTLGLTQLIGEDPAFVALRRKLPLVARHEAQVLLSGETGTGKELCAHAIHYLSHRAGKPFLSVNCGAIPPELFESEFFGHQRGAFTGAWVAQTGLVKEAEGGTLFLDEIDSLSLAAQVKLLRFIEDHTYHWLGSAKERHADVWIIAATNLDLREKVRQGTFREDLFFRLAVMKLSLPPLRERRADIPLLVNHFWLQYAAQREDSERRLSPRAMEALCEYSWPGNVRELQNVIQQLIVLSDAQTIEPADLPITVPVSIKPTAEPSFNQARARIIANFEKTYLEQLLLFNHGNISRAAKEAKKDRRTFGRLVKKYQLGRC